MIFYDAKERIYHLTTATVSYVFRLNGDYIVQHLYYGKKLSSLDGIVCDASSFFPVFSAADSEFTNMAVTTEALSQEYAFYGSCDMRTPSFHALYEDGSRITKPKFVSHKIYRGKHSLTGMPSTYTESIDEADTIELLFRDDVTGLELTYVYSVFSTFDAITRHVRVHNSGKSDINIKKIMSFSIDFETSDFDFIHLPGAWARERHIERRALITGTNQIESRRGSSSHHHSPFFALADKNATETFGNVYGFSFVYSGNFEAGAEVDTYGNTRAYMGINSFDFNWLLRPNEDFISPEVVLVYSSTGIGEMSRIYHRLYRSRLARGKYRDIPRPVLINNWEATYMDFDETKILKLADKAKQAGIEMLVLDDGWFGKRNDTTSSLGDWYPNKQKLPGGLDGLAKRINALGLRFGLWLEPEMVSPDSDLYRKHPDWCLHVGNRKSSLSRDQLILDLSRQDVCEYIKDSVSNLLKSAPIDYIKWDMNRNITEIGSALLPSERQQETAHRYMLGLYDILETLTGQFPDVLFEGCSGGGGRFDAGMMHYFNQYWTSDDTDAVERMYIQHGTSLVMPSVFMGAHISDVPNHQIGRVTSLDTRASVAFAGQFGYELDVTKLSDEEIMQIKNHIKKYKEIRDIVHQGDMYRLLSPFDDNIFAWQYIARDKSKIVLCTGIINAKPQQKPVAIKLQGLVSGKSYHLKDSDKVFSADVLMYRGFYIRHKRDYTAQMLIFEQI